MQNDLPARIALRCLLLGLNVRASHVASLAGHIRLACSHRDSIADSDIDAMLPTLAKQYRNHFGPDASLTPEQKLDLANERLAKREEAAKSDGKITLTEKEQKRFEKLTPAQRLDYANLHNAAAIEAAKKGKK